MIGDNVELILAKLRQEVLRKDQRVEIRRFKGNAALFAARADKADVKLRVVRGERASARKVEECVQRIFKLRRAAQHLVRDAGEADDLGRKPALGVDKGLERFDDFAVL